MHGLPRYGYCQYIPRTPRSLSYTSWTLRCLLEKWCRASTKYFQNVVLKQLRMHWKPVRGPARLTPKTLSRKAFSRKPWLWLSDAKTSAKHSAKSFQVKMLLTLVMKAHPQADLKPCEAKVHPFRNQSMICEWEWDGFTACVLKTYCFTGWNEQTLSVPTCKNVQLVFDEEKLGG